jgi:methylenetetrahydrofolate dehydrogenase (NADP+)/methenyltetrahydrofolate cyclohydrolase
MANMTTIIDGMAVAASINGAIKDENAELQQQTGKKTSDQ